MKNEYAVLKKMDHQNIVTLHEVYQESQMVVYIMDFIEGGEVYHLIKKQKTLKEDDAAFIVKQIADALYALHKYRNFLFGVF